MSYLCLDVIEGGRADNGEADQEDVCLGVGEWSQSVVVFLSSSIPEAEADGLAIYHHARRVVVEPRYRDIGLDTIPRMQGRLAAGVVDAHTLWECIRRERHSSCKRSAGRSAGVWVSSKTRCDLGELTGFTFPTAPSPVTTHCTHS